MVSSGIVVEKYVELIENNIIDVNSQRRSLGKKWVYDDLPRMDITKYPRISVISPTVSSSPLDLGYNKEYGDIKIQVLIMVKKGEKHYINNVLKRDLQVLDHLSTAIISLFKQEEVIEELRDIGVIMPILEAENFIQTDALYMKQLVYKNIYTR